MHPMATSRALCLASLLLLGLLRLCSADTYGRGTFYWDNNQVSVAVVPSSLGG